MEWTATSAICADLTRPSNPLPPPNVNFPKQSGLAVASVSVLAETPSCCRPFLHAYAVSRAGLLRLQVGRTQPVNEF